MGGEEGENGKELYSIKNSKSSAFKTGTATGAGGNMRRRDDTPWLARASGTLLDSRQGLFQLFTTRRLRAGETLDYTACPRYAQSPVDDPSLSHGAEQTPRNQRSPS